MGLGKHRYPILSGDRSTRKRRCQLAVRTTASEFSEERRLAILWIAHTQRIQAAFGHQESGGLADRN